MQDDDDVGACDGGGDRVKSSPKQKIRLWNSFLVFKMKLNEVFKYPIWKYTVHNHKNSE